MKIFNLLIVLIFLLNTLSNAQILNKIEVVKYLNEISNNLSEYSTKKDLSYPYYKFFLGEESHNFSIEYWYISNTYKKEFRESIFKILNEYLPSVYKNYNSFSSKLDTASFQQKEIIISHLNKSPQKFKVSLENFNELINGKVLKNVYILNLKSINDNKVSIINYLGSDIINIPSYSQFGMYFKKIELDIYKRLVEEKNVDEIFLSDSRKSNFLNILQSSIIYLCELNRQEQKKEFITFNNPFIKSNIQDINDVILYKSGELFALKSSIRDINLDFIFDSGASECSISEDVFDEIKKINDYTLYKKIPDGLYKLADGSIVIQERYYLSQLKIGDSVYDNIKFTITKKGAPNLLGQSFLKLFRSWTLDREKKKLILNKY